MIDLRCDRKVAERQSTALPQLTEPNPQNVLVRLCVPYFKNCSSKVLTFCQQRAML